MKKILILLIPLILLTGCSKRITCKSSGEADELTITQLYKINYKGENVTNVYSEKTYKFNDKEQFKNFENLMNYTVSSLQQDNVEVTYKKKNKKYVLIQKYNTEKLTDEQLIESGLHRNKDELINSLKENGLECK